MKENEQFTVLYLYKGNETKVIDWLGETPQIGSIIAINEVYYKVYDVQYRLVEDCIFELKISARDKDEELVYKSVQSQQI